MDFHQCITDEAACGPVWSAVIGLVQLFCCFFCFIVVVFLFVCLLVVFFWGGGGLINFTF